MLVLLRILGVWLLLLAMVAAVIDATKSLAGGGAWVVTPMGQQWQALSPETLRDAKAAIETHVSPLAVGPGHDHHPRCADLGRVRHPRGPALLARAEAETRRGVHQLGELSQEFGGSGTTTQRL